MKLKSRHILITGGNRGIGLALALELNKRGAHPYICSRNIPAQGQEKDEFLKPFSNPKEVSFLSLDMLDKTSIKGLAQKITDENIPIDGLVNNAGLLTGGLIENQPIEDVYKMFQVNLVGAIHLTQLLVPIMVKRGSGKIINNCSVSAVGHLPCASTYAASKAGLMAFTNSLNIELKGTGVSTLTLITPGIKTRMYDEIPNLYGDHMDLDKVLTSISPENYANQVCDAIDDDREFYWPKGATGVAMWLAQHMPTTYRNLVAKKFKR